VFRKRLVPVVGGAAFSLLVSVGPVAADAPAGANNCLGMAFSGLVPEETAGSPPEYGEVTRAQARQAVRDDLITAATGALASCG